MSVHEPPGGITNDSPVRVSKEEFSNHLLGKNKKHLDRTFPGWPTFNKGIVKDFKDVKDSAKLISQVDTELYKKVQSLVVDWSNDGTQPAGVLTRRILKHLLKKKII